MTNKLYIGDNLTILKEMESGSVDVIYTDPPYFTGNKKLTYSDTWKSEQEWIDFMKLRLIECKRVMNKSATILMHIDSKMHIELATLFNSIFGKKNHIETFCWKKRSAVMQSKFSQTQHEYILAYAKDIKKCRWNGIPHATYPLYTQIDGYGQYLYAPHNMTIQSKQSKQRNLINQGYPLYTQIDDNNHYQVFGNQQCISLTPFPGSVEIKPMNGKELGCWRCIPITCQKLIDANMLVIKYNKQGQPRIYQKQYAHFQFNKKTGKLEPFIRTTPIGSILMGDNYPTNIRSNKEIKEIFGKTTFTYSKPSLLVENLIKVISKTGDIVLDPFAGSGTTGEAAFRCGRQFILMQMDEGNIPELIKIRLNKKVGAANYEIIDKRGQKYREVCS